MAFESLQVVWAVLPSWKDYRQLQTLTLFGEGVDMMMLTEKLKQLPESMHNIVFVGTDYDDHMKILRTAAGRFCKSSYDLIEDRVEWKALVNMILNFREFHEHRLLFCGFNNLDPLFAKFVFYPLAAIIFVSLSESLVAPLTHVTILSQVEGRKKSIRQQLAQLLDEQVPGGGGVTNYNYNYNYKALCGRKFYSFAYRFSFLGISSLAYLAFKSLLRPQESPCDIIVFISGGLAALTSSLILLPLDTLRTRIAAAQSSENYLGAWPTFYDSWRDCGFTSLYARLPRSLLVTVPAIAIGFTMYECYLVITSDIGDNLLPLDNIRPALRGSRILLDLSCASQICFVGEIFFGEHGGYPSLIWRGDLISIAHRLTFYGINYFSYLNIKHLFTSSMVSSSMSPVSVAFVSGALAALTATLISHPLDTLRIHIALLKPSDKYEGAWKTFRILYRDGGFRTVYAGMSASLLGVIPSVVISFSVYKTVSLACGVPSVGDSTFMHDLKSSIIASLIASTVTFPIEVVQRRMQMKALKRGSKKEKLGLREVFEKIVKEEGVGGFYGGIHSHLLKMVIGHIVAYTAFEMVKLPCYMISVSCRRLCACAWWSLHD